jgi:hypothetical protein
MNQNKSEMSYNVSRCLHAESSTIVLDQHKKIIEALDACAEANYHPFMCILTLS